MTGDSHRRSRPGRAIHARRDPDAKLDRLLRIRRQAAAVTHAVAQTQRMPGLQHTVTIAAPLSRVWEVVVNVEHWPERIPTVVAAPAHASTALWIIPASHRANSSSLQPRSSSSQRGSGEFKAQRISAARSGLRSSRNHP